VRIRDRGHVNRHLRGLVLDGQAAPPHGAPVVVDGAEIGKVASAAWSFGLARPIALAYVRRQHAEAGTAVGVKTPDGTIPAKVSALPMSR
jgi:glycine cleavage system aminomethyltransferase T